MAAPSLRCLELSSASPLPPPQKQHAGNAAAERARRDAIVGTGSFEEHDQLRGPRFFVDWRQTCHVQRTSAVRENLSWTIFFCVRAYSHEFVDRGVYLEI